MKRFIWTIRIKLANILLGKRPTIANMNLCAPLELPTGALFFCNTVSANGSGVNLDIVEDH